MSRQKYLISSTFDLKSVYFRFVFSSFVCFFFIFYFSICMCLSMFMLTVLSLTPDFGIYSFIYSPISRNPIFTIYSPKIVKLKFPIEFSCEIEGLTRTEWNVVLSRIRCYNAIRYVMIPYNTDYMIYKWSFIDFILVIFWWCWEEWQWQWQWQKVVLVDYRWFSFNQSIDIVLFSENRHMKISLHVCL